MKNEWGEGMVILSILVFRYKDIRQYLNFGRMMESEM